MKEDFGWKLNAKLSRLVMVAAFGAGSEPEVPVTSSLRRRQLDAIIYCSVEVLSVCEPLSSFLMIGSQLFCIV